MKELVNDINAIQKLVSEPFYFKWDFWISQIFAVVGLVITYLAYVEAKKAKQAAQTAANTVKSLTVAMELTDIAQKLDKLDEYIQYATCRDFLNENTRKIKRLITPYRADVALGPLVTNVENALDLIRTSLESVKPYGEENESVANTVYLAVEAPFAALSGHVGELIGSFESRTISA